MVQKRKRTEKTYVLRAQWTARMKSDVLSFVDEERKYPPPPFEGFPDYWRKEGDTLFWKDMEVIATPEERKKLLKKIFYDESKPKGMTAMVRYLNENYVGFKARPVKEWIR
jgi:hypothetical protein